MSTIINGIGRVGIRIAPTSGGGGYTTRTAAFAAATGITDTTILNALNTFDTGLISNGLATKMKALYPFVGGTAATHKYNFMDARDLDIAFRLQFSGGWVHSANGALPNGTNALANTYLIPNVNLTETSSHLSFYSRSNTVNTGTDIGSRTPFGGSNDNIGILANYANVTYAAWKDFTLTTSGVNTAANFILTKNGANVKLFRNSSQIISGTNTIPTMSPYPLTIAGWPASGETAFSNRQCAFSSIGNGLTDGEAATFYTLTQAFQTSLSRAV